jgi:hypothetical protein
MRRGWVVALGLLLGSGAALADDAAKTPQATPAVLGAPKVAKKKATPKGRKGSARGLTPGALAGNPPSLSPTAAIKKFWTCPMDGGHFDHPGRCPKCGMDLVEEKGE